MKLLKHIPISVLAYVIVVVVCIEFVPVATIAVATTFLGLLGQTGYVVMFATRPWRYERLTRAIMLKSATLWLLFLLGAIRVSATGRPAMRSSDPDWLTGLVTAGNVLIIFAIWYQAVALFIEIRKGWLLEAKKYDDGVSP